VTKLRTINDLQDRLDHDISWRIKELANLKTLIRGSESIARKTAVRATVCVTYAHWEGFVKEAAESYIRFVANQKMKFEELSDCFVVFGAKKHLHELVESRKASITIAAVEFFRTKMAERANLSLSNLIRTESNLSSTVFENILLSIGVETSIFSARFNQIDSELLDRRNKIAHGEHLELDEVACRQLVDDVIWLIRQFKTQIENAATLESYKSRVSSR
jgi:MAE_28990/MAE_18760-like HEPN